MNRAIGNPMKTLAMTSAWELLWTRPNLVYLNLQPQRFVTIVVVY